MKEELAGMAVVAKFATTAADGKTYQVEHYNLEMITSIGYRVKSPRGVQFRIWAKKILKEYLLRGYSMASRPHGHPITEFIGGDRIKRFHQKLPRNPSLCMIRRGR